MSYEPTLLIRKSDLDKHYQELELMRFCGDTEREKAANTLFECFSYVTVKFPELELVLTTPEFSSHNKKVRDLLDELGIDYREDN